MRKTILNKTAYSVTIILLVIGVTFGVLRNRTLSGAASDKEDSILPQETLLNMEGEALFQQVGCINCHAVEMGKGKRETSLAGLFNREELPVSGRKVTEKTVRQQIKDPYRNMPSFAERLTEEQITQIISYLKTL